MHKWKDIRSYNLQYGPQGCIDSNKSYRTIKYFSDWIFNIIRISTYFEFREHTGEHNFPFRIYLMLNYSGLELVLWLRMRSQTPSPSWDSYDLDVHPDVEKILESELLSWWVDSRLYAWMDSSTVSFLEIIFK